MTWPDGRMYCGAWKRGKRHGRGIQTAADGSMIHCGLWKSDKPCLKGECAQSPNNSVASGNNNLSSLSLTTTARLARYQDKGQNTSEEDIVFLESQQVAVADESLSHSRSSAAKAIAASTTTTAPSKEQQELPTKDKSLALSPVLQDPNTSVAFSPAVKAIPATPTKADDVSSIGSFDRDDTPTSFLLGPMERISL
jgi:hypothetical protein